MPEVPEFFVNGLAKIEDADGNLRFVFYATRQPAPEWDGEAVRVIRVQIVMPIDAVCIAAMQSAEAARQIMSGQKLIQ